MKKLALLIALSLLAACSPKKSSVRSNVSGDSNNIGGFSLDNSQCAGVSTGQVEGSITSTTGNLDAQAKSLLSATENPATIGVISTVTFSGAVRVDSTGQVLGQQSNVVITVIDSLVATYGPIRINMQHPDTISGQFNQNGQGTLVVSDAKGSITFTGTLNAQTFSGTVTFQNQASYSNAVPPTSGTLGQFSIQRCAFIQ